MTTYEYLLALISLQGYTVITRTALMIVYYNEQKLSENYSQIQALQFLETEYEIKYRYSIVGRRLYDNGLACAFLLQFSLTHIQNHIRIVRRLS